MHELSIAQNIVEMIQHHVPKSEWNRVIAVRLKIGAVAGIVPDSLEFSFHAITSETALTHARLLMEKIPFRIRCQACLATTENEYGFAVCSTCESTDVEVLSGTELQVSEIEIEETVPHI